MSQEGRGRNRRKKRGRRQLDATLDARLGGLIRHRRGELGLSQQALGAKLGLTFQQVQKYEKGSNQLSIARVLQLCEVLQVPIGYFLDTAEVVPLKRIDYSAARMIAEIPEGRIKAAIMRLARECRRIAR